MFKDERIFNYFKANTAAFFDQFPNLHVNIEEMEQSTDESSPVLKSALNFARINARSGFKRETNKLKKEQSFF